MNLDAVRRLLRPMSDYEFAALLREHVLDGGPEDPEEDAELAGLLAQITPENRHAPALDDDAATPAERWLAENGEALESSNAFVDAHGLPLANRTPLTGHVYEKGLRAQASRLEACLEKLRDVTTPATLERAVMVCYLERILSENPGGQE